MASQNLDDELVRSQKPEWRDLYTTLDGRAVGRVTLAGDLLYQGMALAMSLRYVDNDSHENPYQGTTLVVPALPLVERL